MNVISYVKGLLSKLDGADESATDYGDVCEKINKINGEGSLPERQTISSDKYERMTYDAPTDEELKAKAEAGLAEYKAAGAASVENEIKALIEKYTADKSASEQGLERTLKSLNDAYAVAVEEVNADALKRGLARSSVALNNQAALSGERAEKESTARAEAEARTAELDEKLSALELQRQKALDEFNIAYTVKLTERINELSAEREKKQNEVLKYNNGLTEKENDDAIAKAKAESALYGEALEQRLAENKIADSETEAEKDVKYQKIYDVLREKLLSMSAQKAYDEVRNNAVYRAYLSNAYYYKLYDEFGRN